jgi:uncharacterized protein YlxP (DUF503 family)
MKYYYGNSYKEAVSNDPVEINSTRILQQYQDVYNVVISASDVDDEDEYDEEGLTLYIVTFDEDKQNLYDEFDNKEEAFAYAKKYVKNLPCVIKCWQPETDVELGFGEHYKETDITDEDDELSKMIEDQIN